MKVLLVEDQAMVRGALSALLNMELNIEVAYQCANGQEAVDLLSKHKDIELVLSDIEMPEMTGIELVEWIAKHQPQLKTVIITTFGRAGYIKRAIDAGVDGFLLKEAPTQELVDALHEVKNGRRIINSELALLAIGDKDPLNDKERQALRLAAEGFKTKEIAGKLFLSEGTVRNYLSEAISKLHATNRIDAARLAQQQGWL
ncbi:DNA-binding response regulator [Agaribacterium sp. ZY112]|uniref:response regulator transcription factor n=1 Tax=Agaribacterium sp. ZY112 TaxID=3233574 RepID=UPI003525DEF0